ncbi:MAG: EAL domain-containing protein, partial [Syntrophales bacterium LBB04]|nr:EAL domain-containing protein [Syntrophales bacterium LBB04]
WPKDKNQSLVDILSAIQSRGISIALDDFGTGYSSLSYLSSLPINTLKIDRSFIANLNAEHGNGIILAIIAMCRELGLRVVAEGVETNFQKQYLLTQGCHKLQGCLFGKPVSAEEFVHYFSLLDSQAA